MSRVKPKVRESGPKPDEPRASREARDYPDLLAKLPPKKPPAPSVRQRQVSRRRTSLSFSRSSPRRAGVAHPTREINYEGTIPCGGYRFVHQPQARQYADPHAQENLWRALRRGLPRRREARRRAGQVGQALAPQALARPRTRNAGRN